MARMGRPESLEGRWDILYRDYPEVYQEWGEIPMVPSFLDVVAERFRLSWQGKVVLDVGSGTGLSTLALARDASLAIGIEPQKSMMDIATANVEEWGATNVRFQVGVAESLPLRCDSVDAAIGITLAAADTEKVASEMERVVQSGGFVLRGDVAPGWYGGELNPITTGQPRNEVDPEGSRDAILASLGYEAMDVFMDQDYGTVERAVRTYGFIHSKRAVDHIRAHSITTIRWKARARYRVVA